MVTMCRSLLLVSALAMMACSQPAAQSGQDVEALRKEVEAMKRDIAEIRDFLREATGGRFGAPSIVGSDFDIDGAPARGSESAPVTIVEISDYHCPFCRRHVQQTQPQIYSEYVESGKARHVFVHFPIDQLHPEAYRSHEAASCAADQGKFWELHAKLFESPAKTVDELTTLAQGTGLDISAFRACLEKGTHRDAVRQSVARIQQLGVSGTPMFFIGRTPAGAETFKVQKTVQGAHPFPAFKNAIEEVLAEKQ
jgi:protein-disulfide isomerase